MVSLSLSLHVLLCLCVLRVCHWSRRHQRAYPCQRSWNCAWSSSGSRSRKYLIKLQVEGASIHPSHSRVKVATHRWSSLMAVPPNLASDVISPAHSALDAILLSNDLHLIRCYWAQCHFPLGLCYWCHSLAKSRWRAMFPSRMPQSFPLPPMASWGAPYSSAPDGT